MKFKTMTFAALALFAFGLGVSARVAHAFTPCSSCEASYASCIRSGTSEAVCEQRMNNCYRNCH